VITRRIRENRYDRSFRVVAERLIDLVTDREFGNHGESSAHRLCAWWGLSMASSSLISVSRLAPIPQSHDKQGTLHMMELPANTHRTISWLSGTAPRMACCRALGAERQELYMANTDHNKAAELHENAAKSHRAAAEQHGKGDHVKGMEHSKSAQQHSQSANKQSDQAHAKSQQQK
jgi:hypothetical protein